MGPTSTVNCCEPARTQSGRTRKGRPHLPHPPHPPIINYEEP